MKIKKPPSLVYKYRTYNLLTMDALIEDKLFFSNPNDFNDPFDSNPHLENNISVEDLVEILRNLFESRMSSEIIEAAQKAKLELTDDIKDHANVVSKDSFKNLLWNVTQNKDLNNSNEREENQVDILLKLIRLEIIDRPTIAVCCFSEKYNNYLMWSHYADEHRGICIGYSLDRDPKPHLHYANYDGSRIIKTKLLYEAIVNNDSKSLNDLKNKLLLHKGKKWKYEKEWRLFKKPGLHESGLRMKEVIFGLRCPQSIMYSVYRSLTSINRPLDFYQMNDYQSSYKLKRVHFDHQQFLKTYPHKAITDKEILMPMFKKLDANLKKEN